MKLFLIIFASFVGVFNHSPASAQAFGLQMGQKLSELNIKSDDGEQRYTVVPPLLHPAFEFYVATVTKKAGLCRIAGIGTTYKNDSFGSGVRSRFDSLEASLNSKYGSSKRFDFLKYKSIWHESREWVMAIFKKERTLSAYWDAEEGSVLPKGLRSINLYVAALNSSDSYVNIIYEFSNYDSCKEERDAISNSGL